MPSGTPNFSMSFVRASDSFVGVAQLFRPAARAQDGGFEEREITAAKKALLEERRIARAQDDVLTGSLVQQEYLGRTWSESARIDAAIAAVTVESANAAVRKYVDPKGIAFAYAGDFAKK